MTTDDSATREGATDASQQTQEQIDQQLAAQKASDEAAVAEAEAKRKAEEDEMRSRAQDPRRSAMDEIASRRNEDMTKDLVYLPDGEGKTPDELADAAAETERKRLEAEAAETQRQIAAQAGEQSTTLKPEDLGKIKVVQTIDGVSREVTVEELLRQGQKAGAADYRLSQATETLARAEALAKEIIEKGGKGEKKKDEPTVDETENARVKEAIDLMLDGNTEGAAKIFTETIAAAKGRSATPPTAEIVSEVLHSVKMHQTLTTFQGEYKDVVADKYLGRAVDEEFAALIPKDAKGEPLPMTPEAFSQNLRTAGDKVRAWRDSMGGGKKPTAEELAIAARRTLEERKAAKNDLDQTTGAGKRATTTTEATSAEPTPQARSGVISDIAKARGQHI